MKQKILMITMSLDIGGAETHIVELSKELKRRGYDIIVASNGGIYVQEIENYGIRHEVVPMNTRNAAMMIRSFVLLRRLIKRENPDIVHAHARIPAFVAGMVRRTMKFNFVTSAHGVFETGRGLKYLTNWGDKTVAVSDDIRRYLRESYGVAGQNITVTINGIDTDKFSAGTDSRKIVREFGIDPDAPVICHVSRLDDETVMMAEKLISSMIRINREIPGVQLVIAGGGTMEAYLKKRVSEINDEIGRRAIIMTGPRTDINEIVASCDLFVGVSRTALEAMSCEKPVILAGNAGYMGLFRRENLEEAQSDNFCCRSRGHHRSDDLAADIISALKHIGTPEMEELRQFGRKVILGEYSVSRMADDYIAVYDKAVQKPYRILMSGYYGFHNAGDDAILNAIHRNLTQMDENIQIRVLIKNPEEASQIYDYDMVNRFHIFSLLRAIHRCDLLISGGGSLLQDRTSTKSIMYYLTIINLAKMMGKKVMLYANGIGPVIKPANRRRVRRAVSRADVITLRDINSVEELRRMGVNRPDMEVTADPVFTFDGISRSRALQLLKEEGIPVEKPFICVSLRSWYGIPDFEEKMAFICDEAAERYQRNIVFIAMQTPYDTEISQRVQQRMRNPSWILSNRYATDRIMGMVGCADFVLCMRLHTLVFAARMHVPTLGLVYDPKVLYHLKALDMPSLGDVETLDVEKALALIDGMVNRQEEYARRITEKAEEFRRRACRNDELVRKIIHSEPER